MKRTRLEDPDLVLNDLMTQWPQTIPVFLRHRMACVGCAVNPFQTVTDACVAYGIDPDDFYAQLAATLTASHPTG